MTNDPIRLRRLHSTPAYTPGNWYWIVAGDESRVYSSARARYVPPDDPIYTAWLQSGRLPTRIASERDLVDVLLAQYPAGAPPEYTPTPASISMRQARLVRLQVGLLEAATAAVDGQGEAERISWEYATEIRRDDPLVARLASTLGLTDDQLNDLFRQAATL